VYDLAATLDCSNHLWAVFLVELLDRIVARYDHCFVLKRSSCSLAFSVARVSVHPYLEIVAETR